MQSDSLERTRQALRPTWRKPILWLPTRRQGNLKWAGTGSAAISTTSKGTSAGVLARVRTRWFSKPLSTCTDEAGVLCPNARLAGRVIRVTGTDILLLTSYFEHSVGFHSDINANLMHDVCFLTRDGRLSFIVGAGFNFPPSLWRDLSLHGGSLWIRMLGASMVTPDGSTHTCRTGRLTLSKRRNHNTQAPHNRQASDHTEEADPALWDEARRNCVSDGKQPRCQDGQEAAKIACSKYSSAVKFLEEADELGHRKLCDLSHEPCCWRNLHATGMRHFGRWRKCRAEFVESFRAVGQHHPQSVSKIIYS